MGAAEAVICLAIFRDLFDEKQQVRALGIFGMSVALAPAIAPIYRRLCAYLARLALQLLPDRHPRHHHHGLESGGYYPNRLHRMPGALKPARVLGNYYALLTDKQFITYAAMAGVGMGIIYAFITGGPFILIRQLGISTEHFGYYQACIVASYFIGSLVSIRAVSYLPTAKLLNIGLGLVLLGGMAFIALATAGWVTPALLRPLLLGHDLRPRPGICGRPVQSNAGDKPQCRLGRRHARRDRNASRRRGRRLGKPVAQRQRLAGGHHHRRLDGGDRATYVCDGAATKIRPVTAGGGRIHGASRNP